MSVNISIIICTRNRSKRLERLFQGLYELRIPFGVVFEILIINNGSTDDTEAVLKNIMVQYELPVQYLEMKDKGKSKALNCGLDHAQGELILFADDDVLFSPSWLETYWCAFKNHPEYEGFGGGVVPKWDGELPDWLKGGMVELMPLPLINKVDFGSKCIPFPNKETPGGLNAGLRKRVIDEIGRFREDLGPGSMVPYAEDTEFFRRVMMLGGKFLYLPEAKVIHINPPERMTKKYALKWNFDVSRSQAIVFGNARKYKEIAGVPRYLYREFVQRFIFWQADYSRKSRFVKKMGLMRVIGQIKGYVELNGN